MTPPRDLAVVRGPAYIEDLDSIAAHIARDDASAALALWLHIDDQVAQLADPNFPRRPGRQPGTWELVAHANYVVVLVQDATTVTVLAVLHSRRKYP